MDARTDKKWAEILQYAREHATGEGMHKGYRWLQDAFEEYFNDHEERVEKGTMWRAQCGHSEVNRSQTITARCSLLR